MSVFGSRNDDPLLQNDPLAPDSDDESEGEATEDPSAKTEATSQETASPKGARRTEDSVFQPKTTESPPEGRRDSDRQGEQSRVIIRSVEEAGRGAMDAINEALDDGWRLDSVEVNNVSAARRDADVENASTTASFTLAFVLRRKEGK